MSSEPFAQPVNPYAKNKELDEKQKFMAQLNSKLRDEVVQVFANPHGLQLLDTLEDIFLKQPVCPPGCVEGYGYKREGENQLIVRIRNIVTQAMTPVVS